MQIQNYVPKLSIFVGLFLTATMASATAIYDSSNLLSNPGFEAGNKQGWEGLGNVTNRNARTGSYSIRVPGNPNRWINFKQGVSVTAGHTYKLNGWLKVSGITKGRYLLQLRWYKSNGDHIPESIVRYGAVSNNANYREFTKEVIAPLGAVKAVLYLKANKADGIGYYDDLSIMDITSVSAVSSRYFVIEDAAEGAKVTTSFLHGSGQTLQGSQPDPYGYYTANFPKMNDYNEVAALVGSNFSDPRITSRNILNAGEATIWKGINEEDGTGARTKTQLGVVYCREGNSLCGSRALDINNTGVVVGSTHDYGRWGSYPEKSHYWNDRWYRESFGAFSGQSYVVDVSETGMMVGSGIHNLDRLPHAGVNVNGNAYTIGELNTQTSYGHAINNHAEVTGEAYFGSDTPSYSAYRRENVHAYHWVADGTESGALTDLGTLGGEFSAGSVGYDINNAGNIVGASHSEAGLSHAFIWRKDRNSMQALGVLGGEISVARSINDKNQIVGYSTTASGQPHAFLSENGQIQDLNDLIPQSSDWELIDAYHINEYGEILVRGTRGDENRYLILSYDGITKCRSCDYYADLKPFVVDWAGQVTSDANETYVDSDTDSFGNVYSVGYIEHVYNPLREGIENSDLDPTSGYEQGPDDRKSYLFIQKMNADGTYAWTKTTPANGVVIDSINVDVDGNVYLAGGVSRYQGTGYIDVDFSPNVENTVFSSRVRIAYVAKYSSDGGFVDVYTFGSNSFRTRSGDLELASVDTDDHGDLYIALEYVASWNQLADFDPTSGEDQYSSSGVYVVKMSKAGHYLGTTVFPVALTSNHLSLRNLNNLGLTAANGGGFYLSGVGRGFDVDPSSAEMILEPQDSSSVFLGKYDADGGYLWAKTVFKPSLYSPVVTSVRTDRFDNIYVLTKGKRLGNWLQKFDADGFALWQPKQVAGSIGRFSDGIEARYSYLDGMLEVDGAGNAYIIGQGNYTVGVDYNTASTNGDVQFGGVFVTKINSDSSYGGTMSFGQSAKINTITFDDIGNAYAAGSYSNSLSDILTSPNEKGAGEAFIIKLTPAN